MTSVIRGSDNFDSDATSKVLQIVTTQTRVQGTYSAPTSGDGTEITPLTLTITPTAAGNQIILDWIVNGECNQDSVFIATRNGIKLTDTTDSSNNKWAGITATPYDGNSSTTPDNIVIRIIDYNSLNTSSVYKVQIRSSTNTTRTLYLNRTVSSTVGNSYEASLSTGSAVEVGA